MNPLIIPAGISALGSIAGGGISSASQAAANETNIKIAAQNRRFQERMSSTAYQRAVADMKAAGLNPAMAYMSGGASSPAGSSTTVEPTLGKLGQGVSSAAGVAMEAASRRATIDQIRATTEKTAAETAQLKLESLSRLAMLDAQVANFGANMRLTGARETQQLAETDFYRRSDTPRMALLNTLAQKQFADANLTDQQRAFNVRAWDTRLAQLAADLNLTNSSAALNNVNTRLLGYGLNAARNASEAADTYVGRNVVPWLSSALQALGLVSGGAIGGRFIAGQIGKRVAAKEATKTVNRLWFPQ